MFALIVQLISIGPSADIIFKHIFSNKFDIGYFAIFAILALMFQTAGHLVRTWKHKTLLDRIRVVHFREVFSGEVVGYLLNSILPFRLGEFVRAHLVGKNTGISRAAVFVTILFERLVDLVLVVLTCTLAFTLVIPKFWTSNSSSLLREALLFGSLVLIAIASALITLISEPQWFLKLVLAFSNQFNEANRSQIRQVFYSGIHVLKKALPDFKSHSLYILQSLLMWGLYVMSLAFAANALLQSGLKNIEWIGSAILPYLNLSNPLSVAGQSTTLQMLSLNSKIVISTLEELQAMGKLTLLVPTLLLAIALFFVRKLEPLAAHTSNIQTRLFRDKQISKELDSQLAVYFGGEKLNRVISRLEQSGKFVIERNLKGGSNAATILVKESGKLLVKKITLKVFSSKLRSQYDWLRDRQSFSQIAEIESFEENDTFFSYNMRFFDDHTPFFKYIHEGGAESSRILNEVINFMVANVYNEGSVENKDAILMRYIDEKIVNKVLDSANMSGQLSRLISFEKLEINGANLSEFRLNLECS